MQKTVSQNDATKGSAAAQPAKYEVYKRETLIGGVVWEVIDERGEMACSFFYQTDAAMECERMNFKHEIAYLRDYATKLEQSRLEICVERDSLRTDAYRYRFLRDSAFLTSDNSREEFAALESFTGVEFDGKIDALMSLETV